jgi:hypothetical protein
LAPKHCSAGLGRDRPETEVAALFDHLVGDRKQRRRINAERPCDLEIDDKFELDRLVDRQVGKLGTFEKLTDANGENAILPNAVAEPP